MKRKILLADPLLEQYLPLYKKNFIVDTLWNNKKLKLSEYEGLVVSGLFKIPSNLYDKLSNLKIISLFSVGFDNIDINKCKKKNIVLANTPKVLTNDVADLALTFLLSLSRNLYHAHNYIINNNWEKNGPIDLTASVYKKKVGIVGLGEIGRNFAKKVKSLSMEINYYGPNKKKISYKYFKDLKKMARYVDYLVITCIGGEKTNNLINNEILNQMKKTSYLINISRGSVIDEKALIDHLKNKKIKGAALDVFKNEPKINTQFKKLDNVILHPHNGSGTYETRKEMAELTIKNLKTFFSTGKPVYRII